MAQSGARYQFPMMHTLTDTITALDWTALSQSLDDLGYALTPRGLDGQRQTLGA